MGTGLFIAGLALVVLAAPLVSSAQSVADLQAQINALLKQVAALQAQLAGQGGGGTAWCHTFNTNLGIGSGVGSESDEVHALVTALDKSGLNVGMLDVSNYDETTASAISAFQEKYRSDILDPAGLSAGTGYVGARTRAKLNALYGCGISGGGGGGGGIACPMVALQRGCTVQGADPANGICGTVVCPTCQPRPACLDSNPRCLIAEPVGGWCSTADVPVISGVSGPQSLNVNQQGTWSVTASDPSGGNLSYVATWGDEAMYAPGIRSNELQQSATFTHAYSQVGNYTPTFYVYNSSGQKAQTSLSVNVGNVSTTNSGPKITIVTAPQSITVRQQATFSFSATNPNNSSLSWSSSSAGSSPCGQPGGTRSGNNFNFCSSWNTAGSYVVTVYVTDDTNSSWTDQTSFTVNVSGTSNGLSATVSNNNSFASRQVVMGSTNVSLARILIQDTRGVEALGVRELKFTITATAGGGQPFQNLKLYDSSGNVLAGPVSLTGVGSIYTADFNFGNVPAIVPSSGNAALELRGDVPVFAVASNIENKPFSVSIAASSDVVMYGRSSNSTVVVTDNASGALATLTPLRSKLNISGAVLGTESACGSYSGGAIVNRSRTSVDYIACLKLAADAAGQDVRLNSLTLTFLGSALQNNTGQFMVSLIDPQTGTNFDGSSRAACIPSTNNASSCVATFTMSGTPIAAGMTKGVVVQINSTGLAGAPNMVSGLDTVINAAGDVSWSDGPSSIGASNNLLLSSDVSLPLLLAHVDYQSRGGGVVAPSVFVTKNPAVGTLTVTPGSTNVKIGSYQFAAPSQEGVRVSAITVQLGTAASQFQNLKMMINGVQVGATQATLTSTPYTFSPAITIPAGGTAVVDLYADVLNSAAPGLDSLFTSVVGCSGSGVTSNTAAICTNTILYGQDVMVAGPAASAPILSAARDTSSPAGTVSAGQNAAPLLGIVFSSSNGDSSLASITIAQSMNEDPFINIRVVDSATGATLVPAVFMSAVDSLNYRRYGVASFTSPLIIPSGTSRAIKIIADVPTTMKSGSTITALMTGASSSNANQQYASTPFQVSGNTLTVTGGSVSSANLSTMASMLEAAKGTLLKIQQSLGY